VEEKGIPKNSSHHLYVSHTVEEKVVSKNSSYLYICISHCGGGSDFWGKAHFYASYDCEGIYSTLWRRNVRLRIDLTY
jgi:hypothetical protein